MRWMCAILVCATAAADDVSIRMELDPPEIPFHLTSRLSVIVEAPDDLEVRVSDMSPRLGDLDVIDMGASVDELPSGRRRIIETYVIEGFLNAGEEEKLFPIEGASAAWGEDNTVSSPPLVLRLRELTEEERAAAEVFVDDIAPLEAPAPPVQDWRVWLAAIGSIVAVALIVYFIMQRLRRPVVTPPRTAWDLAYERMYELDKRQLPQKGQFGEYYVVLSRIIREYIENHFHIRAPEQTTPEFLADASESGKLLPEHEAMLARFLHRCDRVKFAQYQPSVAGMERDFTDMLRFIDETVPREEPETDREEAA